MSVSALLLNRGRKAKVRGRFVRDLVVSQRYVPDAGDIVWPDFTPQAGHEQAGPRPALVLSPAACNGKTSLMICCPLTTQIKNYPFEVVIGGTPPSAVLADQVKSLDWRSRKTARKGRVSPEQLGECGQKYGHLLDESRR